jgi:hypothetical protein
VRGGVTWFGERAIVYDSPTGNFPSVGGSSKVEWRRDDRGRAIALIVRVTAQDRRTLQAQRSSPFGVRLQPDRACVIGQAATNAPARTIADGHAGC